MASNVTHSSDAARLEQYIRRAFEELAADLGTDARGVSVRVAPIDGEARFAHEEEARVVANAVESRRREFATARRLAHEMLAGLGYADVPILPGRGRAPEWPDGVIGSISHSRGVAAVVIAACPPFTAIGLDVEGAEPLRSELVDTVLTAREKFELGHMGDELGVWAKRAFVVKECAYKAWSPRLDVVPEFTDVEVEFGAAHASFTARLRPRSGMPFQAWSVRGRCARCDGRVFAATLAVEVIEPRGG
jgi:4'-phosphopantetheinyl transferase EntD